MGAYLGAPLSRLLNNIVINETMEMFLAREILLNEIG